MTECTRRAQLYILFISKSNTSNFSNTIFITLFTQALKINKMNVSINLFRHMLIQTCLLDYCILRKVDDVFCRLPVSTMFFL